MSKAGSHASLALSRRGLSAHSHLDDGAASKVGAVSDLGHPYYPGPGLGHELGLDGLGSAFPYPHLQVRGLEVESRRSRRHLLLQGISLEVRGGELMAIMATSGECNKLILKVKAGKDLNTATCYFSKQVLPSLGGVAYLLFKKSFLDREKYPL